jgi:hypothetical protein
LSDLQIEEVPAATTDDADDGFCHILDPSEMQNYCGKRSLEGATCPPYGGEAICPGCGRANCPTCTTMADLNARLVD